MSLASLMNRAAGVFRGGEELRPAMNALGFWREYVYPRRFTEPAGFELQNMLALCTLIVKSAIKRTESRGAHRRCDVPERDDGNWRRRIVRSIREFEG